ncbi:hypothetical protein F7725_009363 [Dissostichus mawsoni]|uniref:Uncharacterized protein n=1 Tax=Dissostichus mawsoni TaxID=36200 RepID=A0A7J5Z6T6_DISMA|nr:hypothetical protein F7725_009363 [Dissostichus mawsoni]
MEMEMEKTEKKEKRRMPLLVPAGVEGTVQGVEVTVVCLCFCNPGGRGGEVGRKPGRGTAYKHGNIWPSSLRISFPQCSCGALTCDMKELDLMPGMDPDVPQVKTLPAAQIVFKECVFCEWLPPLQHFQEDLRQHVFSCPQRKFHIIRAVEWRGSNRLRGFAGCGSLQGRGTMNRHLERREQLKRLSVDSNLPEYMDANKCIDELLKQLEDERRNVRREKLAVARLQREVARSKSEGTMREKLIHELEEERRLRLESEKRLREVTEESELGQAQMDKLSEEVRKQYEGLGENGSPPSNPTELQPNNPDVGQSEEDEAKPLLERLKALEDLREECLKLRTRVFDLEQQNRALGKLHSRIMDLSAADLLLEPERSKAFLLSRNTESPSSELQLNGKSGLPLAKCLSQLSLTAPPVYPRSSCSSSELSLSSACSEFSSGSYTWNDGRSSPSNICTPPEEPTRRKESNILQGLKKLQRRKHRSSSASARVSKSGDKDCMNSNEGIYSLGVLVCVAGRGFRTVEVEVEVGGGVGSSGLLATKHLSGCDSKERPEKLMSFINSFLPEGRPSAFKKPSLLHFKPPNPQGPIPLSDVDDPEELSSESSDIRMSFSQTPERAERDSKRESRDAAKMIAQQCLRREQGRTQSADGRPRPFSLLKEPKGSMCSQSEESLLSIFDAEGEPIELSSQSLTACSGPRNGIQSSKIVPDYAEVVPRERPTRQKSANARNYSVLESPEKPSEYQIRSQNTSNSREGSAERESMHMTPQRKLIKPPSSRPNKGPSVPPMNDSAASRSSGSKIPGRNKPLTSPLRLFKGSSTDTSNSGPSGQEKSPSSPAVKLSRFIKTQGTCSQSPKAVNSKLQGRAELSKGPSSSSSPHLSRRHLDYVDNGEQPTRDKHCETSKNKLRSPSPPPPRAAPPPYWSDQITKGRLKHKRHGWLKQPL